MKKNQRKAPILDAIRAYHERGIIPFNTPGHKQGAGLAEEDRNTIGAGAFYNDISMQNGLDDRRESKGIQEQAEQLAADAIGADTAHFSTNGSSLSAHVAILSVANSGEKILVARNTHKSTVGAMVIADVEAVYLEPEIDEEFDIQHGITAQHLEEMLTHHPDAKGVLIVSPTYYGITSDVKALADICHKHNVPLIVDEAWGPHLPFCKDLPEHALSQGADMSFGSIHKTMNGLGQASIISLKGKRIDEDRFTLCYDLFETTSLSSIILASCDAARRQMVLHGEELWGNALRLARKARRTLSKIAGLNVIGRSVLRKKGTFDMDETKLTLDLKGLGLTGYLASDWLMDNYKIAVELMTHRHIMALITVADTDETVDLFIEAIQALCAWAKEKKPDAYVDMPEHGSLGTTQVMSPTKAFFSRTKKVPLLKAAGCVAAEMVSPYPPGIPRLIPGELITPAIVAYLDKGRKAGMLAIDPSDETLKTLRVVDTDATRT
jgi:arginine/lysine/ornithine decarboxylase